MLLVVDQFDVNNCSGRPAVERGTDELTLTATLSLFVASYHSPTAILALQLSTDTDRNLRHTHTHTDSKTCARAHTHTHRQ